VSDVRLPDALALIGGVRNCVASLQYSLAAEMPVDSTKVNLAQFTLYES